MKNVFQWIALFCLLALAAGFAFIVVSTGNVWGMIALGLAVWIFLAWYCADDQPMFGPAAPGRVTIKQVMQNIFRAAAELLRPVWTRVMRIWAFVGPRVTNRALWAAGVADIALVAGGQGTIEFLSSHPYVGGAVLLLNLLTPLTPQGAPTRIPSAA